MSDNSCLICLQEYSDNDETYTLEKCNHRFHTKCIINWFRMSSRCPCCRDNNYEIYSNIPAYILTERTEELIKISRRSNAPIKLKQLVERLKNIEDRLKNKNIRYRQFKSENKKILSDDRKLRREIWHIEFLKRKIERLIGLFQSDDYPLPFLIINSNS